MLYTLLQFLVWGLLLALVGGVVGWGLRSLKARRDAAPSSAPPDESDGSPGEPGEPDEPDSGVAGSASPSDVE